MEKEEINKKIRELQVLIDDYDLRSNGSCDHACIKQGFVKLINEKLDREKKLDTYNKKAVSVEINDPLTGIIG